MLALLARSVKAGKLVAVIEHRQGGVAHVDWIIDLAAARSTLTGEHFAAFVGT